MNAKIFLLPLLLLIYSNIEGQSDSLTYKIEQLHKYRKAASRASIASAIMKVGAISLVALNFEPDFFSKKYWQIGIGLGVLSFVIDAAKNENEDKANKIEKRLWIDYQRVYEKMDQIDKLYHGQPPIKATQLSYDTITITETKIVQVYDTIQISMPTTPTRDNDLYKHYQDSDIQSTPPTRPARIDIQFIATKGGMIYDDLSDLGTVISERVPGKNIYRYKIRTTLDPDYVISELAIRGFPGAF